MKFLISKIKKVISARAGQSLLEVLIGTVVGVVMIMSAMSVIVPAMQGNLDANKRQSSIALGKEMIDNLRVWSQADWHNISVLATSSANKYFLRYGPSPFAAATGTEGFASDVVNSGLVAYWKLDEAVGNTSYDFSGSDNNGTWINSPVSTSSCKFGSCMVFNGSNNYIQASSAIAFGTGSFSVSFWLRATGTDSYDAIFDEGGPMSSAVPGYQLFLSGGALRYNMSDGAGHWQELVVGNSPDLRDNKWHNFVWSYDGSNSRFYVDNKLLDTDPWTYGTGSPTAQFKIASSWVNSFRGAIDDFRVYNRSLSTAEIEAINKGQVFLRYFYLDDVNRDSGGNITAGGGSYDPATKKITVIYGWPGSTTSTITSYITRSGSKTFLQTDWSGGQGTEGPATTTSNRYASSSNVNTSSTAGALSITGLQEATGPGDYGIDSTYKYAWSEGIGWIDFGSTGTVKVNSTQLKGYANSSIGEISLDCATTPMGNICSNSNFKISNSAGTLSGYAWNGSIGWISFNCANDSSCDSSNYKVFIDSDGYFHGWAWNDSVGWISFNCTDVPGTCINSDYRVKTFWHP